MVVICLLIVCLSVCLYHTSLRIFEKVIVHNIMLEKLLLYIWLGQQREAYNYFDSEH